MFILNYTRTCLLHHANFIKTIMIVEKFVKNYSVKSLNPSNICSVQVGIASMRHFQCVPTTYETEKGKPLEVNAYQVSCQGAQWLSGRMLDLKRVAVGSSLTGVTA